jgi:hypothetical protein
VVFEAVGGFPETPLMEDVLMSLKLRRPGRVAALRQRIFVSPRRWHVRGIVLQTVLNWSLMAGAIMGVPLRVLARFYPDTR